MTGAVDRDRLASLVQQERATYADLHPRSAQVHASARHLFGGVPMTWMNMWSGGFPLCLDRARGNRVVDLDGHEYVDFAMGDTGAMAGHSPQATVDAVQRRIGEQGGVTTMLPTEDAEWVAGELTRRFGLPQWSFTLTATDANRWAIRLARLATGQTQDPHVRVLLPRLGRRGVRRPRPRWRGGGALRSGGRTCPAVPDDAGGGVQRPGRGREAARAR